MTSSKDIKSKFTLQFEAKGTEQTKKKIDEINKGLSPDKMTGGFEALNKIQNRNIKQLAMMQKQVANLNRTFASLQQTVQKLATTLNKAGGAMGGGKGGPSGGGGGGPIVKNYYNFRNNQPSAPRSPATPRSYQSSRNLGPTLPPGWNVNRNTGISGPRPPATQRPSGNFFRGVLQGAGFGEFYPQTSRKGMLAQAGGRMVGGMAAGIGSMPFNGVTGLQQAVSAIPGGGVIAGALSAGQAATGDALAYQQSLLPLAPYLGRSGVSKFGAASRIADAARARQRLRMPTSSSPIAMEAMGDLMGTTTSETSPSLGGIVTQHRSDRRRDSLNSEVERVINQIGTSAFNKANPLAGLAGIGLSQGGLNATETNKFVQGLAGRGGGFPGNGFTSAALSAQTSFGVGTGTSGAFLQASRRGGITGGGNATESMINAMKAAFTAGLDQSEVHEFLENIADRQEQSFKTGINANAASLGTLQGTVAQTGLGVMRGQFIGNQLLNHAQGISQNGPQSAADMLMLQKFGGFKGGSLEDLFGSMGNMEDLNGLKPEQFLDFVKTINSGSGGGTGGKFSIKNVFRKMGAPVTNSEVELLQKAASGAKLTDAELAKVSDVQSKLTSGKSKADNLNANSLNAGASADVNTLAGGVKSKASIDDLNIVIGTKLLPSMIEFEKAAQQSALALTAFEPTLKLISGSTLAIASKLPAFAASMEKLIEHMMRLIGVTDISVGPN